MASEELDGQAEMAEMAFQQPVAEQLLNNDVLFLISEYLDDSTALRLASTLSSLHARIQPAVLRRHCAVENQSFPPAAALIHAVRKNHFDLLRQILSLPVAVELGNDYRPNKPRWAAFLPPVALAATKGNTDALRMLYEAGAKATCAVEVFNTHGVPMARREFACRLARVALTSDTTFGRFTPLGLAIVFSPTSCTAQYLIEVLNARRDNNLLRKICGHDDVTHFDLAVMSDKHLIVRDLVNNGVELPRRTAELNNWPNEMLPLLHNVKSVDMLRLLVNCGEPLGPGVQFAGYNPLHSVCRRVEGDFSDVIKEMIKMGVPIDERSGGPHVSASGWVKCDDTELAWTVTDPDTALGYACRALNVKHIGTLLRNGASPTGVIFHRGGHDADDAKEQQEQEDIVAAGDERVLKIKHREEDAPDVFPVRSSWRGRSPLLNLVSFAGVDATRDYFFVIKPTPGLDETERRLVEAAELLVRHSAIDSANEVVMIARDSYSHKVDVMTPFQSFIAGPVVDSPRLLDLLTGWIARWQIDLAFGEHGHRPLLHLATGLPLYTMRFDYRDAVKEDDQQRFYAGMRAVRWPLMVAWLLGNGADPNAKDKAGLSALHYAVAWLEVEVVKALVDRGATGRGSPCTPLHLLAGRVSPFEDEWLGLAGNEYQAYMNPLFDIRKPFVDKESDIKIRYGPKFWSQGRYHVRMRLVDPQLPPAVSNEYDRRFDAILEMLLQVPGLVFEVDEWARTPLWWALQTCASPLLVQGLLDTMASDSPK